MEILDFVGKCMETSLVLQMDYIKNADLAAVITLPADTAQGSIHIYSQYLVFLGTPDTRNNPVKYPLYILEVFLSGALWALGILEWKFLCDLTKSNSNPKNAA